MREYEFILKFRLPDPDADPGQYVDALAAAGCDDATIGVGQRGRIALDFAREERTAQRAISSAVRAVMKAIPGAQLIEASPDIVGLTDVAELVGCTRQNIRKLMLGNVATFPIAMHEGTQSLWHLRPVLDWFADTQKKVIDHALMEVSGVTMKINIAKEAHRLPGTELPRDMQALFA